MAFSVCQILGDAKDRPLVDLSPRMCNIFCELL